jgi:hypothetical protein
VGRVSEARIERYLVAVVKHHGGFALKLNLIGRRGWPDRLVLIPGGHCCFVELKRPGARPRKLQERVHQLLRRLGFNVVVLDSEDKVDEWTRDFLTARLPKARD